MRIERYDDLMVAAGAGCSTEVAQDRPRSRARATRIVLRVVAFSELPRPLRKRSAGAADQTLYTVAAAVCESAIHFTSRNIGKDAGFWGDACHVWDMWRYMMHASLLLSCLCLLEPVHRSHQLTTKDSSRYCLLLGNVVIVRIVVQVDFFGIRLDRGPAEMVSVMSERWNP